MGIIEFVIVAVLLGVLVWLIQTYTPIDQRIKTLILVVVLIVLVLLFLYALGIVGADVQIPRVR